MTFKFVTRKELAAIEADKQSVLAKCQGLENEIENLKNMSQTVMEEKTKYDENIAALRKENEALATNNANAIATLKAEHEKVLADMKAAYEKQLADTKAVTEKETSDIKLRYEAQLTDLSAKVTLADGSAEVKAQKILGNLGVPAAELPKVKHEDKTQILDEAKKLQGNALSEYFEKNKKAIFEALKEKATKKD